MVGGICAARSVMRAGCVLGAVVAVCTFSIGASAAERVVLGEYFTWNQ